MRKVPFALLRSVVLAAAAAGLASCATTPAGSARVAHAAPAPSHTCLTSTGSRLPPPKGQCLNVPGRSYTQQDIQRTGATNPGEALSLLDPSVTAH